MRSRYTAYARLDESYLLRTWHASTRPGCFALDKATQPEWIGLAIEGTTNGGPMDSAGTVTFTARFRIAGRPGTLKETSRFVREQGQWFYVDGDAVWK